MTKTVFHLGVTEADLNGATLAIIPGDPARVQKIAELMDNPVFSQAIVNIPYTAQSWMGSLWWCVQPVSVDLQHRLRLKS